MIRCIFNISVIVTQRGHINTDCTPECNTFVKLTSKHTTQGTVNNNWGVKAVIY